MGEIDGKQKQSTLVSSILICSSTLVVGFTAILGYHRYWSWNSLYNSLLLGGFFFLVVIVSSVFNTNVEDILVASLLLIYIVLLFLVLLLDKTDVKLKLVLAASKNRTYKYRKRILVVYVLYALIFTGIVGWGVYLRIQNGKDTRQLNQFQVVWRVLAIIFTSVISFLSIVGIRTSTQSRIAFKYLLPQLILPKESGTNSNKPSRIRSITTKKNTKYSQGSSIPIKKSNKSSQGSSIDFIGRSTYSSNRRSTKSDTM